MERVGFKVYAYEWWHFDFVGWGEYPLMNLSFEELK
jgi:D-alanyl-D-alanine dipeptidase